MSCLQEDFSPSEEDMIMTRTRTTGIVVSGKQLLLLSGARQLMKLREPCGTAERFTQVTLLSVWWKNRVPRPSPDVQRGGRGWTTVRATEMDSLLRRR